MLLTTYPQILFLAATIHRMHSVWAQSFDTTLVSFRRLIAFISFPSFHSLSSSFHPPVSAPCRIRSSLWDWHRSFRYYQHVTEGCVLIKAGYGYDHEFTAPVCAGIKGREGTGLGTIKVLSGLIVEAGYPIPQKAQGKPVITTNDCAGHFLWGKQYTNVYLYNGCLKDQGTVILVSCSLSLFWTFAFLFPASFAHTSVLGRNAW